MDAAEEARKVDIEQAALASHDLNSGPKRGKVSAEGDPDGVEIRHQSGKAEKSLIVGKNPTDDPILMIVKLNYGAHFGLAAFVADATFQDARKLDGRNRE